MITREEEERVEAAWRRLESLFTEIVLRGGPIKLEEVRRIIFQFHYEASGKTEAEDLARIEAYRTPRNLAGIATCVPPDLASLFFPTPTDRKDIPS